MQKKLLGYGVMRVRIGRINHEIYTVNRIKLVKIRKGLTARMKLFGYLAAVFVSIYYVFYVKILICI